MSKMSELDSTIKELRSAAEAIKLAADTIAELFSGDSATESNEPEKEKAKVLTLPEVRAILAEKARAGFAAEIKELLCSYGADKLSAIDPKQYAALVAEAEELSNAT